MRPVWAICVHGGSGDIPDALEIEHRSGCARAAEAGSAVLGDGGSALDAVCAAVRVLERDPLYNAGIGAALDRRGLPAVDAAVMRGSDLAYGAVGAVVGLENPVDAARAVLEDGRHCLLVGAAAGDFARSRGVRMVSPDRLVTPKSWAIYQRRLSALLEGPYVEGQLPNPSLIAANVDPSDSGMGNTVGAVARDGRGTVAAATSTGGLSMRAPGRVGDSPIAGAGTYARDDLGAASATGHGETMMRTVFAFQALLDWAESSGRLGDEVLREALDRARDRVGGTGGVIAIRPDGTIAFARNTAHMGVAYKRAGEETRTAF